VTPQELTARAKDYVDQALARYKEVGPFLTVKADGTGILVSLRANLESAQADLAELLKAAAP